jgi:membrane glycosyltransferase
VQAPLRMLAHSVFVVGALTGLRLDWKSPSRDAAAVAWRDALARIGVLALPALGLALLVLVLQRHSLDAPYLAPLLLPLLLAVPFTVWTGGPMLGRQLERVGLLSVPEERQRPRALLRGAQLLGFCDLVPAPVVALRAAAVPRGPLVMAMASAALVALVLLPRTAWSPELSPALHSRMAELAQMSPPPSYELPTTVQVAAASSQRPQRSVRYRPASTIDDAVRRRAYEAVALSLETESS